MTENVKQFNVSIGQQITKKPTLERADRAVKDLKKFLARHLKLSASNVAIDPMVNEFIWERSAEKPARYIKVKAVVEKDSARVYLHDQPIPEKKAKPEKAEKKGEKAEAKDAKAVEKHEHAKEEHKGEKKAEHSKKEKAHEVVERVEKAAEKAGHKVVKKADN